MVIDMVAEWKPVIYQHENESSRSASSIVPFFKTATEKDLVPF